MDLDDNGYPLESALEKIRVWPVEDLKGLISYLESLWYQGWGFTHHGNRLLLATGGWSGNEDIVGALQGNHLFWSLCWVSSRRGGYFEFDFSKLIKPEERTLMVYLAGPDVFLKSSTVGEIKKGICSKLGFDGLYPLDNEITGEDASKQIYSANCQMIARSDLVVANVSPFRGPHCDPGTAFEIGMATQMGKPVHTYSNDARTLLERVKSDYPAILEETMVENFGEVENLMIAGASLQQSVCVDDRADLSAMKAFERLMSKLSDHYRTARPQETPHRPELAHD
ncbi:MAG: hypothetical protein C9356_20200 [Oleiphilus sp.]|nr:MAG: hypothetical protein C9356_20200 [Oleiphilus sp.]